jgi:hypothetical protein
MVASPMNVSGVPTDTQRDVERPEDDANDNSLEESQGTNASRNFTYNPPPTTCRKAGKKTGKARIGKGKMVRVKRKDLYHLLTESQCAYLPHTRPGISGDYPCMGRVVGGTTNSGWIIAFDDMPQSNKEVTVNRNKISLLEEGDYEVPIPPPLDDNDYDDNDDDDDANDDDHYDDDNHKNDKNDDDNHKNDENDPTNAKKKGKRKMKRLSPDTQSVKKFCMRKDETVSNATAFDYHWGRDGCSNQKVSWKIHGETEYITESPLQIPDPTSIAKDVDFKAPLIDNFFQHMFLDVTGHGKIMDAYLQDARASHHSTYLQLGHTFHDQNATDPDWLVKQCYTLMIASVSEVECGIENLWKKGSSGGRQDYPDFGQYVDIKTFKCFTSAAAYCWAESSYWYRGRCETPWEVFLPCIKSFNDKRQQLLESVVLLLLDESMSGWRPKTSKLGGLPNYTFEPRKPISLGSMFRNGAECTTGLFAYQDPVQLPEHQAKKKYHGEPSSLPDSRNIGAHTAEVL